MREWQSQAQVKHYCRYHIVFVPKYHKQLIYGTLQKEIKGIFRELCHQGGLELVEGYGMRDHIHMLLMIINTVPVPEASVDVEMRNLLYIFHHQDLIGWLRFMRTSEV